MEIKYHAIDQNALMISDYLPDNTFKIYRLRGYVCDENGDDYMPIGYCIGKAWFHNDSDKIIVATYPDDALAKTFIDPKDIEKAMANGPCYFAYECGEQFHRYVIHNEDAMKYMRAMRSARLHDMNLERLREELF